MSSGVDRHYRAPCTGVDITERSLSADPAPARATPRAGGALRSICKLFTCQVVLPGDVACSGTLRLRNAAVATNPLVFVCVRDVEDTRTALRVGRECDLAISVRGGGHDRTSRALGSGGLVTDPGCFRRVSVDAAAQIATLDGGATAREVVEVASPHGLVPVPPQGRKGQCTRLGNTDVILPRTHWLPRDDGLGLSHHRAGSAGTGVISRRTRLPRTTNACPLDYWKVTEYDCGNYDRDFFRADRFCRSGSLVGGGGAGKAVSDR